MRRIKTLVVLVTLALVVIASAIGNRSPTLAADYSCHNNSTCPGQAQCSGDHYNRTGPCAYTCYRDGGAPGEIVNNGSANCAPPSGGGGGGGGGGGPVGFNYTEGQYCQENWWWDFNCSGPDDTYKP